MAPKLILTGFMATGKSVCMGCHSIVKTESAKLANNPVARDPPPAFQPRPRPMPGAVSGASRFAHQPVHQGQALERGEEVGFEAGISRGERLGNGMSEWGAE